jgi:peptidoglycan/xylan/chitin deacetylase (PgdA/CDA1 family)
MYHARDGAIVVLHDIHLSTINAMRRVIPELIEQGFVLVTASEIIELVYGGLKPGYEFTGTRGE